MDIAFGDIDDEDSIGDCSCNWTVLGNENNMER